MNDGDREWGRWPSDVESHKNIPSATSVLILWQQRKTILLLMCRRQIECILGQHIKIMDFGSAQAVWRVFCVSLGSRKKAILSLIEYFWEWSHPFELSTGSYLLLSMGIVVVVAEEEGYCFEFGYEILLLFIGEMNSEALATRKGSLPSLRH